MTLDLNQLHVESFETSTGTPELMRLRGSPSNEVILCAAGPVDGTLALMAGPPTEDPDYC